MLDAFDTRTHLGAYLYEENHFRPNGLVGFAVDVLTGYADSSGKESTPGERVLTVNGCLSTPEKWQAFDVEWQAYLKDWGFKPDPRTNRFVFHTTDFWSRHCKLMPTGLSDLEKKEIYFGCMDLIGKHTVYRFGYGIVLEDYRRFEENYPYVRNHVFYQPGSYLTGLCFRWNSIWAEENGFDASISYTLDRGDEFWSELAQMYQLSLKKIGDRDQRTVDRFSQGDKAIYSPLQAADIIAWEARQYFLSLKKPHLTGLVSLPHCSPALNSLGKRDKNTNIRVYSYRDLKLDLQEWFEAGLKNAGTISTLIGEGKLFASIDDWARYYLEFCEAERIEKKQADLDAWREKKKQKGKKDNEKEKESNRV